MTTICLCMIVKNEAPVIARCLASVDRLIDHWSIVDTGSTDGTQDVIRRALTHKPGELYERPWKNFGHNRTEAVALARGKADYLLTLDADEILVYDEGFDAAAFKRGLVLDAYEVPTLLDTSLYNRLQLVNNHIAWRYEGVLHEYLISDEERSRGVVTGIHNRPSRDGARSRDPDKYGKDAELLEQALREEPGNTRYLFYLAQSYRDSGQLERAVDTYLRRAEAGGWAEEVFYAYLQAGRLEELLQRPSAEVLLHYLQAYQAAPHRAESLCSAARHSRLTNQHHLAYVFARLGLEIPRPEKALFVEMPVYDWMLADEHSIAAYWTEHYQESYDACTRLLTGGRLPESERGRVLENRQFAEQKLGRVEPGA